MHRLALHVGFLVAGPLLAAGIAVGEQQSSRESVTIGDRMVPRAPVGHRQPRASDVPANPRRTASDDEHERRERELDKKLRICRGC